ncbi:MAG: hypothetical protein Q4D02_00780 [Clostridia bacterium]|nr:hypothetical protein [Clostridia bacterium]
MALEYFFKNTTNLLPKEEYHVGMDNKVILQYENQDFKISNSSVFGSNFCITSNSSKKILLLSGKRTF